MKPAIIVVDMFEDAFSEKHNSVTLFARAIVPVSSDGHCPA
jgi:hypothetical protein